MSMYSKYRVNREKKRMKSIPAHPQGLTKSRSPTLLHNSNTNGPEVQRKVDFWLARKARLVNPRAPGSPPRLFGRKGKKFFRPLHLLFLSSTHSFFHISSLFLPSKVGGLHSCGFSFSCGSQCEDAYQTRARAFASSLISDFVT